MYKIVAVDLDGTLLNSSGEVSEYTKHIIQKAINKGTDVILASRKNNKFGRKYSLWNWI